MTDPAIVFDFDLMIRGRESNTLDTFDHTLESLLTSDMPIVTRRAELLNVGEIRNSEDSRHTQICTFRGFADGLLVLERNSAESKATAEKKKRSASVLGGKIERRAATIRESTASR